jgi:hypothetical protein
MNLTDFEKARSLEDLWIRGAREIFDSRIPRQEKVDAKPILKTLRATFLMATVEEGVLLIPSRNPRRPLRANYYTMLIPESVAKRVHAKYSFGKQ